MCLIFELTIYAFHLQDEAGKYKKAAEPWFGTQKAISDHKIDLFLRIMKRTFGVHQSFSFSSFSWIVCAKEEKNIQVFPHETS